MKTNWLYWFLSIVTLIICETKYGYVALKNNKLVFKKCVTLTCIPRTYRARASFKNHINSTGWAFLEVYSSPSLQDEQQAYAAGFLEGYLTRDLIWMHWLNMLRGYCYNKTDLCGLIENFIDKNDHYIASMVGMYQGDPYWYQVKLYYIQLEGMAAGYNEATSNPYQWLTTRDIVWLNMLGDLDDLAFALSMPKKFSDDMLFSDHCTGLVKLLPDLGNLYVGHTTWNSYQSMLRFQKVYVLHYQLSSTAKRLIPGYKMSFTSYPAFVQSSDDFYIISTGLVAGETTITNSNRSLLGLINPFTVMEYVRSMVANRLATDGYQWTEIFRLHNSGTYNNQWYIVDYKRFKPSHRNEEGTVQRGLLWIIEQLPGFTESADLTENLVRDSYFPSYNVAYFPDIFNMSGGNERVATFGQWFGYNTNPRAAMLKNKQESVNNLRDMYDTMRYNDFKHDPLARCDSRPPYSACNAIAARNDLNPSNGIYPFRALGHRSHGSTDAKVTSWHLSKDFEFIAVSGPPYNISRGIPPFAWSEFDLGARISHMGHPDLWVFQPVLHHWEWK